MNTSNMEHDSPFVVPDHSVENGTEPKLTKEQDKEYDLSTMPDFGEDYDYQIVQDDEKESDLGGVDITDAGSKSEHGFEFEFEDSELGEGAYIMNRRDFMKLSSAMAAAMSVLSGIGDSAEARPDTDKKSRLAKRAIIVFYEQHGTQIRTDVINIQKRKDRGEHNPILEEDIPLPKKLREYFSGMTLVIKPMEINRQVKMTITLTDHSGKKYSATKVYTLRVKD